MMQRLAALLAALFLVATPLSAQEFGGSNWQCAPFARLVSGVQLFGNAASWWAQAEGRYERGAEPKAGAVLVFKAAHGMRVGHVATVSEVVSDREILITHANWSPINGRRGQVEADVRVIDVSAAGDWSRVRVHYAPIGDLGTTAFPTFGFIYADEAARQIAMVGREGTPAPIQTAGLDLVKSGGVVSLATAAD